MRRWTVRGGLAGLAVAGWLLALWLAATHGTAPERGSGLLLYSGIFGLPFGWLLASPVLALVPDGSRWMLGELLLPVVVNGGCMGLVVGLVVRWTRAR